MSVKPLCCVPHPVLRAAAAPVAVFDSALRHLVRDMIETMYANDGIGLAAPQIGQSLQLFVASPTQQRGKELVLANPALERAQGRTSIVEGCLSVPKVWQKVPRHASLRLRAQNLEGAPVVCEVEGLLAIVLQHEVDHLNGILFIDRLSWLKRRRLKLPTRPLPRPAAKAQR
jgi:peptide deformylase